MSEAHPYNPFFRQLSFLGILVVVGLIIIKQLGFFVGAFLGAITMYVVLRKVFFRLTDRRRWKKWFAAFALVAGMTVILLGLGFLVFEVVAGELPSVDISHLAEGVEALLANISETLGFNIAAENVLERSSSFLGNFVSSIFNTTYSFAANVFMMLIILYFMLANARAFENVILRYQPFRGDSLAMIEREFHTMVFSNAIGIPMVMIGQGVVAALIYWAVGLNNVIFWAFLTALCGLIPMVGTALVSVPLGIYLIVGGGVWQGVVLIICGVLVIANVDNVIRMILLKKVADTHPLTVVFGVILGIPLFGFWGIIFGPLLISGFLLLIKIYYTEYRLLPPRLPHIRHNNGAAGGKHNKKTEQ